MPINTDRFLSPAPEAKSTSAPTSLGLTSGQTADVSSAFGGKSWLPTLPSQSPEQQKMLGEMFQTGVDTLPYLGIGIGGPALGLPTSALATLTGLYNAFEQMKRTGEVNPFETAIMAGSTMLPIPGRRIAGRLASQGKNFATRRLLPSAIRTTGAAAQGAAIGTTLGTSQVTAERPDLSLWERAKLGFKMGAPGGAALGGAFHLGLSEIPIAPAPAGMMRVKPGGTTSEPVTGRVPVGEYLHEKIRSHFAGPGGLQTAALPMRDQTGMPPGIDPQKAVLQARADQLRSEPKPGVFDQTARDRFTALLHEIPNGTRVLMDPGTPNQRNMTVLSIINPKTQGKTIQLMNDDGSLYQKVMSNSVVNDATSQKLWNQLQTGQLFSEYMPDIAGPVSHNVIPPTTPPAAQGQAGYPSVADQPLTPPPTSGTYNPAAGGVSVAPTAGGFGTSRATTPGSFSMQAPAVEAVQAAAIPEVPPKVVKTEPIAPKSEAKLAQKNAVTQKNVNKILSSLRAEAKTKDGQLVLAGAMADTAKYKPGTPYAAAVDQFRTQLDRAAAQAAGKQPISPLASTDIPPLGATPPLKTKGITPPSEVPLPAGLTKNQSVIVRYRNGDHKGRVVGTNSTGKLVKVKDENGNILFANPQDVTGFAGGPAPKPAQKPPQKLTKPPKATPAVEPPAPTTAEPIITDADFDAFMGGGTPTKAATITPPPTRLDFSKPATAEELAASRRARMTDAEADELFGKGPARSAGRSNFPNPMFGPETQGRGFNVRAGGTPRQGDIRDLTAETAAPDLQKPAPNAPPILTDVQARQQKSGVRKTVSVPEAGIEYAVDKAFAEPRKWSKNAIFSKMIQRGYTPDAAKAAVTRISQRFRVKYARDLGSYQEQIVKPAPLSSEQYAAKRADFSARQKAQVEQAKQRTRTPEDDVEGETEIGGLTAAEQTQFDDFMGGAKEATPELSKTKIKDLLPTAVTGDQLEVQKLRQQGLPADMAQRAAEGKAKQRAVKGQVEWTELRQSDRVFQKNEGETSQYDDWKASLAKEQARRKSVGLPPLEVVMAKTGRGIKVGIRRPQGADDVTMRDVKQWMAEKAAKEPSSYSSQQEEQMAELVNFTNLQKRLGDMNIAEPVKATPPRNPQRFGVESGTYTRERPLSTIQRGMRPPLTEKEPTPRRDRPQTSTITDTVRVQPATREAAAFVSPGLTTPSLHGTVFTPKVGERGSTPRREPAAARGVYGDRRYQAATSGGKGVPSPRSPIEGAIPRPPRGPGEEDITNQLYRTDATKKSTVRYQERSKETKQPTGKIITLKGGPSIARPIGPTKINPNRATELPPVPANRRESAPIVQSPPKAGVPYFTNPIPREKAAGTTALPRPLLAGKTVTSLDDFSTKDLKNIAARTKNETVKAAIAQALTTRESLIAEVMKAESVGRPRYESVKDRSVRGGRESDARREELSNKKTKELLNTLEESGVDATGEATPQNMALKTLLDTKGNTIDWDVIESGVYDADTPSGAKGTRMSSAGGSLKNPMDTVERAFAGSYNEYRDLPFAEKARLRRVAEKLRALTPDELTEMKTNPPKGYGLNEKLLINAIIKEQSGLTPPPTLGGEASTPRPFAQRLKSQIGSIGPGTQELANAEARMQQVREERRLHHQGNEPNVIPGRRWYNAALRFVDRGHLFLSAQRAGMDKVPAELRTADRLPWDTWRLNTGGRMGPVDKSMQVFQRDILETVKDHSKAWEQKFFDTLDDTAYAHSVIYHNTTNQQHIATARQNLAIAQEALKSPAPFWMSEGSHKALTQRMVAVAADQLAQAQAGAKGIMEGSIGLTPRQAELILKARLADTPADMLPTIEKALSYMQSEQKRLLKASIEKGGMVSAAEAAEWERRGDYITPMTRLFNAVEATGQARMHAAAKMGSSSLYTTELMNPFGGASSAPTESALSAYTHKLVRGWGEVARSESARKAVDWFSTAFPDYFFKLKTDAKVPYGYEEVPVWREGVKERWAMPAEYARPLLEASPEEVAITLGAQGMLKPLKIIRDLFTRSATTYHAGFFIANPWRDVSEARFGARSKEGKPFYDYFNPKDWARSRFIEWGRSFYNVLAKSDNFMAMLDARGGQSGITAASNPEYYMGHRFKIEGGEYKVQSGRKGMGVNRIPMLRVRGKWSGFTVDEYTNAAENATKLMTWDRGKAMGLGDEEVAGVVRMWGGSPDFAGGGTMRQVMSLITMFLNPNIQERYRVALTAGDALRELKGSLSSKGAVSLMSRMMTSTFLTTLASEKWNSQFLDEEGLPEIEHIDKRIRGSNSIVFLPYTVELPTGERRWAYIRLPRSFPAQIMHTIWDNLKAGVTEDPNGTPEKWAVTFGNKLLGDLLPGSVPIDMTQPIKSLGRSALSTLNPAIAAPIELGIGVSAFTGSKIVPTRLEPVSKELQFTPRTNPGIVKLSEHLAQWAPAMEWLQISPIEIQWAMERVSPGPARAGLAALAYLTTKTGVTGTADVTPFGKVTSIPVIGEISRRFVGPGAVDQRLFSSRERMYDAAAQLRQAMGDLARQDVAWESEYLKKHHDDWVTDTWVRKQVLKNIAKKAKVDKQRDVILTDMMRKSPTPELQQQYRQDLRDLYLEEKDILRDNDDILGVTPAIPKPPGSARFDLRTRTQ
jgi:hypothetical protein